MEGSGGVCVMEWRGDLDLKSVFLSIMVLAALAPRPGIGSSGMWARVEAEGWPWINLLQLSLLKASSPNDWFL